MLTAQNINLLYSHYAQFTYNIRTLQLVFPALKKNFDICNRIEGDWAEIGAALLSCELLPGY
jgi:hypothetical protein